MLAPVNSLLVWVYMHEIPHENRNKVKKFIPSNWFLWLIAEALPSPAVLLRDFVLIPAPTLHPFLVFFLTPSSYPSTLFPRSFWIFNPGIKERFKFFLARNESALRHSRHDNIKSRWHVTTNSVFQGDDIFSKTGQFLFLSIRWHWRSWLYRVSSLHVSSGAFPKSVKIIRKRQLTFLEHIMRRS